MSAKDRQRIARLTGAWAAALVCAALATSCGGDDDGDAGDDTNDDAGMQCLAPLPDCTLAYAPSYQAIFDEVLKPSCGSSNFNNSCHYGPTAAEAKAGLVLSDPDKAYDTLLGKGGARARVIPGDPECSVLMQRLESRDPKVRMPRGGDQLKDKIRCVVREWIKDGAKRDEPDQP